MIKQSQRTGTHRHAQLRTSQAVCLDIGTGPAEKADSAMYEDEDDDRFEAALRMAEDDPARAAEALRSIVADDAFDPDTRSEAAARLAEVGG